MNKQKKTGPDLLRARKKKERSGSMQLCLPHLLFFPETKPKKKCKKDRSISYGSILLMTSLV